MATVTIAGVALAARGLTPLELTRWNAHVSKVAAAMYWVDLYNSVETLPERVQEATFANNPPPTVLSRGAYFRAASRRESVQILASMVLDDPVGLVVTEDNAAGIFWDLLPMVLNEPVTLPGEAGLAKIRESLNAGST